MSGISDQATIANVTRTSQIIVAALISGVLTFVAIAFIVDLRPKEQPGVKVEVKPDADTLMARWVDGTAPIVTAMAVAFAVVLVPLSFVVPNLVSGRGRREIARASTSAPSTRDAPVAAQAKPAPATETGMLAALCLTNLIIGAAMDEGVAFFATVAYMIERHPVALGLALLMVALLIVRFPTATRIERWFETQREKLTDERYRAQSSL
jgi:hypothetical protein